MKDPGTTRGGGEAGGEPDPRSLPFVRPPTSRRFGCAGARAVDREAIEEWGIPGPVLMERAALALARIVLEERPRAAVPAAPIVVVCGTGNNGGDGWAFARHLANLRADGEPVPSVVVVSIGEPRPGGDAALNAGITRRMGVPIVTAIPDPPASVVVDAILGTGVDRAVTGPAAEAIAAIVARRAAGAVVVAVDVPSGLDADTGRPAGDGPAVAADVTVSLMGPKLGFDEPDADRWIGRVVVGDIGVPRTILDRHAAQGGG